MGVFDFVFIESKLNMAFAPLEKKENRKMNNLMYDSDECGSEYDTKVWASMEDLSKFLEVKSIWKSNRNHIRPSSISFETESSHYLHKPPVRSYSNVSKKDQMVDETRWYFADQ